MCYTGSLHIQQSATYFGFGDPDVLSGTDILAICGHRLTCDLDLLPFDIEHCIAYRL